LISSELTFSVLSTEELGVTSMSIVARSFSPERVCCIRVLLGSLLVAFMGCDRHSGSVDEDPMKSQYDLCLSMMIDRYAAAAEQSWADTRSKIGPWLSKQSVKNRAYPYLMLARKYVGEGRYEDAFRLQRDYCKIGDTSLTCNRRVRRRGSSAITGEQRTITAVPDPV